MDKDFALAWTFVDDAGRPMQLRFRLDPALDGTGQLIAVIADAARGDYHDETPISRPGVLETAVDEALDGWQDWALLHSGEHGRERWISLTQIHHRIHAARLD